MFSMKCLLCTIFLPRFNRVCILNTHTDDCNCDSNRIWGAEGSSIPGRMRRGLQLGIEEILPFLHKMNGPLTVKFVWSAKKCVFYS